MTNITDNEKINVIDLLMITIGCGLYALGFVKVNMANNLAEGGVTGITLIIHYWMRIDPSISTLLINIPLIVIGYKYLGKKALLYTVYGTVLLSIWIWIWQRVPIVFNIHHDLFIAGALAGIIGGFGSGIVYRYGGTTGGSDVVARIFEKRRGVPMGRSLLVVDAIVLSASLSYIDLRKMMYTLLASYVFSKLVTLTQDAAYTAAGFIIISNKNDEIANDIMTKMDRGVTFLKSQGGYSKEDNTAIYCVVSNREIATLKRIALSHDPQAFISTFNVNRVEGEGFTYHLPSSNNSH